MVRQYFLIVAAFTILLVPNASAEESYSFGFQPGTIKFDTNLEDISCSDVMPEPEIGTATTFNIDDMDDHFFIFLSKINSNTHHYLQIEIPDDNGKEERDSYLINFLKDGEPKSRQIYHGYGQMSVYMITDSQEKEVTSDKHKQFLTGDSLKVSPHSLTYPPGEYDLHSILFQSDQTRFVDDAVCAISLHWNVSVDTDGNITTEEPSFTVGRVYLSDEPDISSESSTQNTEQNSVYLAIGTIGKDLDGVDSVGIVYVYDQNYSLVGTINNPEGKFHGQFGQFIKSNNDKLVISAPWMYAGSEKLESGDYPTSANNPGTAYLFDEISGNFIGILSDPYPKSSSAEFGIDLDITADTIVVSDPNLDVDGINAAGAIHVYDASSGDLIKTILNPEPKEIDLFGNSVANLNDNIVVGIPGKDVGEHDLGGTVVILDIDSGAIIDTIENPEPVGHDEFGKSIATSNDFLLVAAPFMDIDGEVRAGSVYLFDGSTGSLIHTIHNPDPDEQDNFGKSLLFFEDKILVGVPGDGILDEGSVYVFDIDSGSLIETIKHPNRDVSTELFWGNEFGHSLAYHDGKIIIGDKNKTVDGKDGAGSVYVYNSDDYSLIKTIPPPNPTRIDSFGYSVAFINNISGFVEPVTTDLPDNQDEFIVESDQEKEQPDSPTDKQTISYQVGTIDWLEDSSEIGGYGTLKIADPDMDKSDLVDIFTAFAWSDTDKDGIELDMIETGRNTGIFYIDVEFTIEKSAIQELRVSDGDTVTAMYRDTTLPDDSQGIEITDTIEIIQSDTGSEQSSQQSNSLTVSSNNAYFLRDQTLSISGTALPGDTLAIRMTSPDGHFARIVDKIKTDPNDGSYNISLVDWKEITREFPKGTYKVEVISEDNPDISKSISVNRILKEDLFSGKVTLTPLQQTDIGIASSNVFCKDNMKLVIKTHNESPACINESSAEKIISRGGWEQVQSEKEILWMKSEYTTDDTATVQITDSRIKWLDSGEVNNFTVRVWSDSDLEGITLMMTETGETTGLYKGTVFFSTDESSGHRLKVSSGDEVFIEYASVVASTFIQ